MENAVPVADWIQTIGNRRLGGARTSRDAQWTLQTGTLPIRGNGCRLVSTLKEGEQHRVRIRRGSYRLIRQHELTQSLTEKCRIRLHRAFAEASRLGVG